MKDSMGAVCAVPMSCAVLALVPSSLGQAAPPKGEDLLRDTVRV